MMIAAHLQALYSAAPIILWVEDATTRDYLTKIWADPPEIAFLIAGGSESILAAVQSAEREKISHVFGLIDRDFGSSNVAKWFTPTSSRTFYLPRHEIENYLLDEGAMANCSLANRGRTDSEIHNQLFTLASRQPSWLACRRVLTDIRRSALADFPPHPSLVNISSITDAEQFILSSDWYQQILTRIADWTQTSKPKSELQQAEALYADDLNNDRWKIEFSGKEMFRPIRDFVYQPPQNPGSPDSDFAKSIGECQEANRQVPTDLIQLRSALRSRVGLSP